MPEIREKLRVLLDKLKIIQDEFYKTFNIQDIYTNSKFFEILIADTLNHTLIPGHAGSRDAKNQSGGNFEYKHYKETSSNHSWTFNDFSETTIQKLSTIKAVIFAYINDVGEYPIFQWYYEVPGNLVNDYLLDKTRFIHNIRKMINVSPKQIEEILGIHKTVCEIKTNGQYTQFLRDIFQTANDIEQILGIKGVLTSNKLWEILIGIELGHRVLSDQKQYDAIDNDNNYYEYKVSKSFSFSFEDISENVLNKFKNVKKIILAVVNKERLRITAMYEAEPQVVVQRLKLKLEEKQKRYEIQGKEIRRLQVSLSKNDLRKVGATKII